MNDRRPRLGDTLDDYCPRERRITNHAVVAMIEDEVKRTRCTTCDAEHEYRQGKAPARRKRAAGKEALFDQVLAGKPQTGVASGALEPVATPEPPAAPEAEPAPLPVQSAPASPAEPPSTRKSGAERVHRPLIRATLPRTGPAPRPTPARPLPSRTLHGRGGASHGMRTGGPSRPGGGPPGSHRSSSSGGMRPPSHGEPLGPMRSGGPRPGLRFAPGLHRGPALGGGRGPGAGSGHSPGRPGPAALRSHRPGKPGGKKNR